MKAIILAGGEGTRLRPLSLRRPKPMLRLFDRPLLEYLVCQLRDHGFTELCMTLRYLPQSIQAYFGTGEEFGVSIEYRVETLPRGTAGSVRDCADFLNGEDFLVISGDAACSLDFRAFYEKHRLSGADATLLTHTCSRPLEYGLVISDDSGFVRSFLEKPAPGDLCTDQVNTGIYAFSCRILQDIPPTGVCDFGADVFPQLIRQRRRVRVWNAEGYWNDVGSCGAYLQTCRDVLDGRFPLPIKPGVSYDAAAGPVWISGQARVEPGAELGPYTVIGAGSLIEAGSSIRGSIIDGAFVGQGAQITDSILAPDSAAEDGVRMERGCVAADGVRLGRGSVLLPEVRIWPGAVIPAQTVVFESIMESGIRPKPEFDANGLLVGGYGLELTPTILFRLGSADVGGARFSASASGGKEAKLLMQSFLTGCASAGRAAVLTDAGTPAEAAFSASAFGFDLTLFLQQQGRRLRLYFFDRDGLPISRAIQRRLESAGRGEFLPVSHHCGSVEVLSGVSQLLRNALSAVCGTGLSGSCSLIGNRKLSEILSDSGLSITPPEEKTPQFFLSDDGLSLSALDEQGRSWSHEKLLLACCLAELDSGSREICLSSKAPYLAETIAIPYGAAVYRLDRDASEARRLLPAQRWAVDAAFLCCRIIRHLFGSKTVAGLSEWMDRIPRFYQHEVVSAVDNDLRILRKLAIERSSTAAGGVTIPVEHGQLRISRIRPNRLRILAESESAEFAAELCAEYRKKLSDLDTN